MSEFNGRTVACEMATFATGVAVGAGLMLLFAPKAGRDTRDDLARKIGELKDAAGEAMDKALNLFRRETSADAPIAED